MTGAEKIDLAPYLARLESLDPFGRTGVVVGMVGLLIASRGPEAGIGDFCEILASDGRPIRTQVIGFRDGNLLSMPLEETGGPQSKDISGAILPGISRWAVSAGGEYHRPQPLFGRPLELFVASDASYRSSFSSSATPSRYLSVPDYTVVNARVGVRAANGWALFLWSRNMFDMNYFELLSAAPGNSGLYVGQPGDPRAVGVTLRLAVR